MEIRYLGQSGFLLSTEYSKLLIDPAKKENGDIEGNIVYCTHKHGDHTGGVETFLEKNRDAILICNAEVADNFSTYPERTVVINPSSTYHKTPWSFRFVDGRHGLMKGIMNTGVVIDDGEASFGHPGDSTTFAGFYHIELDYLAVPIGGMFTTSPKKVIEEIAFFKKYPTKIVPMHWLVRKPQSFCKAIKKRYPDIQCIVPKKGYPLE